MTGNTHIAVGVASSLIILQPKTVPECLCAITGGIIGGMICDIDSPGKRKSLDYRDDPYGWQIGVFVTLVIAFLLGIDYLAGNGAVDYIRNHLGPPLLIGGAVFLGVCIFGTRTPHRTFMHSLLAGVLLSVSMWFFCRPLATPFVIGLASHLIIDFFNKKKVQYLWPIPLWIGLNKFPSDGKLNGVLEAIGTLASIFLFAYFFINSFAASTLLTRIIEFFSIPVSIKGYSSQVYKKRVGRLLFVYYLHALVWFNIVFYSIVEIDITLSCASWSLKSSSSIVNHSQLEEYSSLTILEFL